MRVNRYSTTVLLLSIVGIIVIHTFIFLDTLQLSYISYKQIQHLGTNLNTRETKQISERVRNTSRETDKNTHKNDNEYVKRDMNKIHSNKNIIQQNIDNKNVLSTGILASPLPQYKSIGINLKDIKSYIAHANKVQLIHNKDRYAFPRGENSTGIVVQVHNRTDYLRTLIKSFARARYIENSLLIFSHDYFNEEINKIILLIDFCPVIQIFYPFSIQLYPDQFPGEDPNDCHRDVLTNANSSCNNVLWPDMYGHYREAKYTQIKHHWFWKISHVFDRLKFMQDFDGPVLFVEEDHVMVEDFIHVLHTMYRFRDKLCIDCSIMTLGTYVTKPSYDKDSKKVAITNFASSKHNMGMALTRQVWSELKSCADVFCQFDDYNWDWSLQHVSTACLADQLKVMYLPAPRIFHIGDCGMHHSGTTCDPAQRVGGILELMGKVRQYLYPDTLEAASKKRARAIRQRPNGGWGDVRDHELCMSFVKSTTYS